MKCCFLGRSTSPQWSENEIASNSGRLVLSELRRRSFCHPSDRPNRIPALVSLAGKRAWLAVNLMTVVRRLAKYFGHPVDQTEAQSGHWDITRIVRLD